MRMIRAPLFRPRLRSLEQSHPEWRPWLALYEATLRTIADPVWTTLELRPSREQPRNAPLLEGLDLVLDPSPMQAWLRYLRLLVERETGEKGVWPLTVREGTEAFAVLEATIRQDFTQLPMWAATTPTQLFQTFAQFAVMPLLHASRRRLAARLPATWPYGYCPYCGMWAVVAEQRGLERTRHLRCGRCGGEWRTDWLRCPFCGESRHKQLTFLVPEGRDETQSLAACASCQHYIKTLTTLQGTAPEAVMLDDLRTVPLDIIAMECGYHRPRQPGYSIQSRLVERARPWSLFLPRFT